MRTLLATWADAALAAVESLFPKVPVAAVCPDWQPPAVYYFTDDVSLRLWPRLKAVCLLDRPAVSFYRRRREALANPASS